MACLLAGLVAPAAGASPTVCEERDVVVTVTARSYRVHGLLCSRPTRLKNTVQVVMAGATEGGLLYWDFPHADDAEQALQHAYSYVEHITDLGYASFTIDRIGTGDSDRPPAQDVTIQSNADVLHQLVAMLRDGTLGRFRNVVAVGRSLSGPVAFVEAATYRDLDGIVIQSFRHHQEPPFAQFAATLVPAQLVPHLADTPAGYLTTRAGTRAGFFFTANADPRVVAHEEANRDTITGGEVATFFPSFDVSRSIDPGVPVLSVVGELDPLFCTPGCPRSGEEVQSWPSPACFRSVVIEGVGHDMNLEPGSSDVVFPVMTDWFDERFGRPSHACL